MRARQRGAMTRTRLTGCPLAALLLLVAALARPAASPWAAQAAPAAAAGQAASLAAVEAHLAATRTMTASFTQVAQDGASLTGQLTLERPGRVRFQYDAAPLLVVADGRTLSFIDYRVAQVSSWPVRQTPLAALLDPGRSLARYARVLPESRGSALLVEARDPERPEYGALTLSFARDAAAPGGLRLEGWEVLDAQGRRTRIVLENARYNVPVARDAFRFRDPRVRSAPGKG
jgi:outer membrane lipoprotein-sorting protein